MMLKVEGSPKVLKVLSSSMTEPDMCLQENLVIGLLHGYLEWNIVECYLFL